MPKFLIKDTFPCYVTFRRIIAAETAEEAESNWLDGEIGEELEPEIGDSIDWAGGTSVDITEQTP